MTARANLQAAIVAALARAGLTAFDASPVRGGLPYVVVDEAVLADWGTKTWEGREGRVTLRFYDGGERPTRLRDAIELGEAVMVTLPAAVGGGWRVVQMRAVRSRIVKAGERWVGTAEFLVRMWREEAG